MLALHVFTMLYYLYRLFPEPSTEERNIIMNAIVKTNNLNPHQSPYSINIEIPSRCPKCGVAYASQPRASFSIRYDCERGTEAHAYSLYFCPNCNTCFLVDYLISGTSEYHPTYGTFHVKTYPAPTSETKFSSDIAELSPSFIRIYHQAEEAENAGLSEICGLGYRKALEFLVKDYAIVFYPDDEATIKNLRLVSCINTYIENRHIKALATASAWLGNDETHYVRKHEDYNLEHLKAFIHAVVSCIDSELSYLKAEELLNTPKK